MLIKLYPILHGFARRKEERAEDIEHAERADIAERVRGVDGTKEAEGTETQISHRDWVNADRIVMLVLVLGVIIAAIIFS